MKFWRVWSRRIITFVGIVLLLVMVMDLNSRMVHMYRLQGERDAEQARVEELEAIEADLELQIAYANSEDIVTQWAREQNLMQEEGDFIIALLPNGDPPPEEITQPYEGLPEMSNWEAWRWWLSFRE